MTAPRTRRAALLLSLAFAIAFVWWATALQSAATRFSGALYLHSGATDSIDAVRPSSPSPTFKDSPPLESATFQLIGGWSTAPFASSSELQDLRDFTGWAGVIENGDRSAKFDLRVEILKNAQVIASATDEAVNGLQPPGGRIREFSMAFGQVSDRRFDAEDSLSLRLLARLSKQSRPGARIRFYYDAPTLASSFRATLVSSNTPPVANAGPDQTAVVGQTVTLDGSTSSDVDGDSLTFNWSLVSRPSDSSASLLNPSAVKPTFVVDRTGTYTIHLTVNDGQADSAVDIVIVSTLNSRPSANAGPNQTATFGATVTLDGSQSSDPDGDALTYLWSFASRPPGSSATLQNPTTVNPTFVVDAAGDYVVRLIVNDGVLDSDPATTTISTVNSPPVADAGPNRTAVIGDLIGLDGSGSTDVDGDMLTYRWSLVSKPAGSSATPADPFAVTTSFVVDQFGDYVAQLIVNDGTVDSEAATVTISLVNSPPVAEAGPDQHVSVGALVQVDGSGSTDADGNLLLFTWSIASKPQGSQATLSSASIVNPMFAVDQSGSYVLQLIVNDGIVNSAPSTLTVSTENRPPVANAGQDQTVAPGATVALDGSGSNDPDGDGLSYTWSMLSRPPGSVAELSDVHATAPTFEADQPGTYVAQLTVNDGQADSVPDTVSITTNNAAPIADPGQPQTVPAGSLVQLDGSASFDPDGSPLSYAWSLTTVPPDSSATLQGATTASPSFVADRRGTYVARLIVDDGSLTSDASTVTITATNRPPVARDDSGSTVTDVPILVSVLTNDSDADGDTVTIIGTTQPTHGAAVVNGNTTMTYTPAAGFTGDDGFTYTISDGQGGEASASVTVTVVPIVVGCPVPTITSFDPVSGPVGTEVTITGAGFDCGNTKRLLLNGTELTITQLASAGLKTFIPIGGQSGPFNFTTDGGSVTPPSPFTVTRSQDLALQLLPASAKVVQDSFTNYLVKLSGTFTGLASLTVSGLPPGATGLFSPPFMTAGQQGMLTVAATAATPPGISTFDVHVSAEIDAGLVETSKQAQLNVLLAGTTALAGTVLDTDAKPIRAITLRLDGLQSSTTAVTDEAGNFLMLDLVPGEHLLLIDGDTASDTVTKYPMIPVTVTLVEGVVNRLSFQPYLHAQKNANFTIIDPAHDTIVTDPELPGVMMRIPAGVQIIGWDGQPNQRVSIRAVPIDRLPIEPPPVDALTNTVYMFYFGKVGGGTPSQPIPFTAPNQSELEPGDKVDLWYYDESPIPGDAPNDWRIAGTSTVSADGTLIITDPGVGIPRFCCGAVVLARRAATRLNQLAGLTAQKLQEVLAADPVDLSTGIFMFTVTDMKVPGRMPVEVTRTYRSGDFRYGAFGPGTWTIYSDLLPQTAPGVLTYVYRGRAVTPFYQVGSSNTYITNSIPAFSGTRITVNPSTGDRTMRHRDGSTVEFSSAGYMTAMKDTNGNQITVARTWGFTPDRIVDPSGRLLSFTKLGDFITSVSDPLGQTVRYQYDGGFRLTKVTQADGTTTQYAYDSLSRMTSITDAHGITYVKNTYDVNSRVCQQEQADGGKFTFYYITVDSLYGSQSSAIWQAATGGPVTVAPCSAGLAPGRVMATVMVDPSGRPTTYRFNGTGYLVSMVDALGRTSSLERDFTNQVRASTDPLGRRTTFTYDISSGNLTQVTDPTGGVWQYAYESTFNKVIRVTDPVGNVTALDYDARGNLTGITDPEQHNKPIGEPRLKTTIGYDASGQPNTLTDPLGNVTTATYDGDGNIVTIIDPTGAKIVRTYDLISRLLTQTDGRGRTVSLEYDKVNRIISALDAINGVTRFGYNPNGNLVSVKDARGNTTEFSYDAMDRLAARTDPLGRRDVFTYDLSGRMVGATNRKDQTSVYEYDIVGRPTRLIFGDGSTVEYAFDAGDRALSITDSIGGTVLQSYDTLDRLIGVTSVQGSVRYGYDRAGRRTSMSASGQMPVIYGFDANSQVNRVIQGSRIVTLGYDANKRRTSLTLPNGVSTQYHYDMASRLTEQIYTSNSGTIGNLTYQYDRAGNRRGVGGTLARTLLPDAVSSASYDAGNRQLQFGNSSMVYDLAGNLTSLTDPTGVTTFTWDARQRLTNLNAPSGQSLFGYDAFGRRATQQVGAQLTRTLFDGLTPASEHAGATRGYLTSPRLDEPWVRNDSEFYIADALGSIIGLTNAAGALTTRYTYDPFGRTAVEGAASSNPFQFTGRENDGSGRYFYRARYYSPQLGRFLSEDPTGFGGGDVNVYAYVSNSPLNFVDPLGLEKVAYDYAKDWITDKAADIAKLSYLNSLAGFWDDLNECKISGTTNKKLYTGNLEGELAEKSLEIADCFKKAAAGAISPAVGAAQQLHQNMQNKSTLPATPPPGFPRERTENGYHFWEYSPGVFTWWRRDSDSQWTKYPQPVITAIR